MPELSDAIDAGMAAVSRHYREAHGLGGFAAEYRCDVEAVVRAAAPYIADEIWCSEVPSALDKARAEGIAAERQRWQQSIVRKDQVPERGDTHAECFVPLDLLDGDDGAWAGK